MDLAAISIAIAIAAVGTIAFAALLIVGHSIPALPWRRSVFASDVSNGPAEALQNQWQNLGRRRALLLLPVLFLIISTATLLVAEPAKEMFDLPRWQQLAVLAIVSLAVGSTAFRVIQYSVRRQRLLLKIHASQTVGHALRRITANLNRTFHDVPTSFGSIDHVVVGIHGIYAVKVIARRPLKNNRLQLHDDVLEFAGGKYRVSLKDTRRIVDRFARECAKVVHHDVHVRLIVAVPGWEIETQSNEDVLVTHERNLPMLTGWKDQRDHLLNEDADALHRFLDERCSRPART
jgi:hypothetical protein